MGKLVKINNQQQTTGEIIAYFQEGFTIPPMGNICLINMSCEMEERSILISDENNTFERSLSTNVGNFIDVEMNNGLYDVESFLIELNRALNASLRNERGAQQGFQFKVSLTPGKLLKISYNRVPIIQQVYFLDTRTKWTVLLATNGNNGFTKTVGSANAWNSAVMSSKYFTGGAGAFTCVRTDASQSIIGLVSDPSQTSYGNDFDVDSYKFCMFSAPPSSDPADPHVYWTRYTDKQGEVIETETTIQAGNHLVGLMLTGGKLVYFWADDNVVPLITNIPANQIITEIDWSYDEHYYGMISIYTQGTSLNRVNFWNDPFHQITNTFSHYHEEEPEYNLFLEDIDNVHEESPSVGGSASSIVQLRMPLSLQSFLGFPRVSKNPDLRSGKFTGNRPLSNMILPQNLKVVLDNLNLESYDNVVKQHESILMTVPSIVSDDGKFVFNAQFPLQIELNNKYPINISEIRLRLIDFQRKLIRVKPDVTDITLLIS